jgi:hypothetical protein
MTVQQWPDCPDCDTDVFVSKKAAAGTIYTCLWCDAEWNGGDAGE